MDKCLIELLVKNRLGAIDQRLGVTDRGFRVLARSPVKSMSAVAVICSQVFDNGAERVVVLLCESQRGTERPQVFNAPGYVRGKNTIGSLIQVALDFAILAKGGQAVNYGDGCSAF